MCRLSWNLEASTSWNPHGLPSPVQGLLYLYPTFPGEVEIGVKLSVDRKWRTASRRCLLQITCQPGISWGVQTDGNHRVPQYQLYVWLVAVLPLELTDHPPYTPHLAHNDFHPSDQSRTKNLAGKQLATDADTKQAVNSRLETPDKYSFHAGMQTLVPRWDKCLNVSGDSVEVWCVPCATHVLRESVNPSRNKVLGIEVLLLDF
jgi:hypothetical protein